MKKKLFILELNEFNLDILKKYSNKFNLPNIKKIIQFNSTKTLTNDRYLGNNNQHGYLDPWSQWVSIHTGKPSKIHKIKNLGDIPKLKFKQIWEKRKKEKFYIWGPMNASKRNSKNVKVFFPDPWVFSEKAYPTELNSLLSLIKHITKTRGKISKIKKIKNIIKIALKIKNLINYKQLFLFISNLIKGNIRFGKKNLIFIIAWEYISACILINLIKNEKSFISIFFLNALAHVQHHYWKKKYTTDEITYCLEFIDNILGEIFKVKNIELIVLNGLSQKNVEDQKLCLYEQKSHEKFLKQLNINFKKIEKLMTNDAFIFFKKKKELLKCNKILSKIMHKNRRIFYTEIIDDKKLFYKTNFIKRINYADSLIYKSTKTKFLDHFSFITLRRGIHSNRGDILSQNRYFPKIIMNHNFFKYIK